jgi:hypothetical protein
VRAPELKDKLELIFYPHADHTFFLVEHRERVMDRVIAWLLREFGGKSRRTVDAAPAK